MATTSKRRSRRVSQRSSPLPRRLPAASRSRTSRRVRSWASFSCNHVRRIMRRLSILGLALLLLLVVLPGQAFAHGLGQSQNLPLPFWLYLFAAATVVLLSFVQVNLL